MVISNGATIRHVKSGPWMKNNADLRFTKADIVSEKPNTVVVRLKRENEHMTFGHVLIEVHRAHIKSR